MGKKRLAIYAFNDRQGIVDSYVSYILAELKKHVEEIVFVGDVLDQEKNKITSCVQKFISAKSDNASFFELYRTALNETKIEGIEEIILLDSSVYGPIDSFDRMFETMKQQKDLDFWGITSEYDGDNEYIQSYFLAIRKKVLESDIFQNFMKDSMAGKDFVRQLYQQGFVGNAYVSNVGIETLSYNPMRDYPKYLIEKQSCPVFLKSAFEENYSTYLQTSIGKQTRELFEYVSKNTKYNEDFVWENILRTCHQADLVKSLQLDYVLSSESLDEAAYESKYSSKKTALFMHLYFDDLVDESLHYASSVPAFVDIYITTNTSEKKEVFAKAFSKLENKVTIKVVPNRGRDVSSLLVSLREEINHYELACFYHDKKAGQSKPGSVGESFGYKCAENVLHNKAYVYRILKLFYENERLGLLSPPEPNHAEYFATLGFEWFGNYENTEELAKKLNIQVPMSRDKEPVAPFGSVFWFRVKALDPLQSYPWKYEDFPEEPLPIDSTISHAIERIRPFAAQAAGFYPAVAMVDKYASIELTNLRQYMRNYEKFLENHNFLVGRQSDILAKMEESQNMPYVKPSKLEVVSKKLLPAGMYSFLIKIKRRLFGPHI